MKKLFGTDGIRGTPGEHPLTDIMIFKIGRATARLLLYEKQRPQHVSKIVIGKDTRQSCDHIERLLSSGICFVGAQIILAGTISTPGLAFLTRHYNADMGLMISASHNRAEDNGIKFFSTAGYKLSRSEEQAIEELIASDQGKSEIIPPCVPERITSIKDATRTYIDFLKYTALKLNLKGLRIAVDCAHGALSSIAPVVFRELGARVISIKDKPNGVNINQECGSLYPDVMRNLLIKRNADIGFCFDGDGDRVIIADEEANILDGDHIMSIIGLQWIKEKKLSKKSIVTTEMSNYGLQEIIEKAGGRIIRTDVGDRNVTEEMIKNDLIFGGEQSGHVIFLNHTTTGDAMITALEILKVVRKTKKKLSKLISMRKFPQVLKNVRVREKKPLESISEVSRAISESKTRLSGQGRLLVRYSGTESVARVMVEGKNQSLIEDVASLIAASIHNTLGIKE